MNNQTSKPSPGSKGYLPWLGLLFAAASLIYISVAILARVGGESLEGGISNLWLVVGVVVSTIIFTISIAALLIHYGKIGPFDKNYQVPKSSFFKTDYSLWIGLLFFGYGIITLSKRILALSNGVSFDFDIPVLWLIVGVVVNAVFVTISCCGLLIQSGMIGPYGKNHSN